MSERREQGHHLGVVEDLAAEGDALDRLIGGLDEGAAATPTPAAGWDIRATVDHLAGAARLGAIAVTEPARFSVQVNPQPASRDLSPRPQPWAAVRERWRRERVRLVVGLRTARREDRVPWVAGSMSATSFASAQLMETWAHGVDIAAALRVPYPATARLRHVADLGVRTRRFALALHGRHVPDGDVRVEVHAPDGRSVWVWGESRTDWVRGDALDFCLVVTQRRHVDDSGLEITGPDARAWMEIAQAFAGPATVAPRSRG